MALSSRSTSPDRRKTARDLLQKEIDKLAEDERAIVERFVQKRQVSRNIVRDYDQASSLGERVADRVAAIGGSWSFILVFLACLIGWMVLNSVMLGKSAFDPYPYILLNLCLSCVAAIQAPVIMMSQNRQGTIDRMRAQNDYAVNVKAELEVMQVQEKINLLRDQDWAHLVELQQQQILMLQRLVADVCGPRAATAAPSDIPEQKSE